MNRTHTSCVDSHLLAAMWGLDNLPEMIELVYLATPEGIQQHLPGLE